MLQSTSPYSINPYSYSVHIQVPIPLTLTYPYSRGPIPLTLTCPHSSPYSINPYMSIFQRPSFHTYLNTILIAQDYPFTCQKYYRLTFYPTLTRKKNILASIEHLCNLSMSPPVYSTNTHIFIVLPSRLSII